MSSLQEWLAAQREQLAADRTEVIPVPGYEKRLAGRYRLVHLTKADEISQRASTAQERAADLLAWSCDEILEIIGDNEYRSTGAKWTKEGIVKLFGHSPAVRDLPEDATTRDAIFAVFPPPLGEYKLLRHVREIDIALDQTSGAIAEELRGNSEAGSAAEEPSISQ